ncbi:integrase [Parabacteroides distasonis]|uniref:integrase n=1 Tax=Parabacteroides distasonis TaxID=823 RepID=UPI003742AD52
MPLFPKQAANSLVTETLQYFVLFCRSDYHAILVKCLIINDLRLIRTILFFIAFLNITYTARHTWATIAYNDLRISKDDIAFCLIHASNHKITEFYIKPDYMKVDEINRKVIDWVYYGKK